MADSPIAVVDTAAPVPLGPDVVVITAHPQMEHSRINRRLMRAARRLPASADSPSQAHVIPAILEDPTPPCRKGSTSSSPRRSSNYEIAETSSRVLERTVDYEPIPVQNRSHFTG